MKILIEKHTDCIGNIEYIVSTKFEKEPYYKCHKVTNDYNEAINCYNKVKANIQEPKKEILKEEEL